MAWPPPPSGLPQVEGYAGFARVVTGRATPNRVRGAVVRAA